MNAKTNKRGIILLITLFLISLQTFEVNAQDCVEVQPNGVFEQNSDVLITGYHQSIAKSTEGFVTWGEDMGATGSDQLTMTLIDPSNGYNFTGTPIHYAVSGNFGGQGFMATTTNLYVWGQEGEVVSSDFLTGVGGNLDAFAPMLNVPFSGADVKDLHASTHVLFVLLNDGTVWVATTGKTAPNGNSSTDTSIWQQVQTSTGVPLTNVSQVTGSESGGYALLNNGDIYAWGDGIELGDGTAGTSDYDFATKMNAPPVPITYIGAIYEQGSGTSGVLALGNDAKVYGIGDNTAGQIITTTTANVETWTTIKASGGGDLTDVLFLSTTHNTSEEWVGAAVITAPTASSNGKNILRVWGRNNFYSLAKPSISTSIINDPTVPLSFTVGSDDPAAVGVGGHAITYFNLSNGGSICFAGHISNGSEGGLTTGNGSSFDCVIPTNINLCGLNNFIQTEDDSIGVIQGIGGVDVINVLENDILNGEIPTTSTVTVAQISTTNAGVTLGTDGLVDVASTVPTGTYTIVYEICETGITPANCDTAQVTVFVSPDSDGDGIPDLADIDDDNDGILDVDECDPEVFAAGAIPTTVGAAIAQETGIGSSDDILSSNDTGAVFKELDDELVIAFGATLPVGTNVVVRVSSQEFNAGQELEVQQSTAGDGTGGSNPYTITSIAVEPTYTDYTYVISGTEATHLIISVAANPANKYIYVDHVSWLDSNVCVTDGDTDGDGIINSLDLDSDNDGIPDNIEAQTTLGYIAPLGLDSDLDGLDDAYDATPNGDSNGAGSIGLNAIDTDGDNIPDYVDLDADNDGIFDVDESSSNANLVSDGNGHLTCTGAPTPCGFGDNGLINFLEAADDYSDVNGIFDDTQGDNFTDADNNAFSGGNLDFRENADFDGDGIPNVDDIDDDNDGIPDLVETGGTDPLEDLDNDGVPAYLDDNDNNNAVGNDDNATQPEFDTDGDGRPNHLDLDSDNDGITDIRENGGIDNNNDGEVDYPTPGDASTMVDVDGDGLDDELDNVNSGDLSGNGEVTNGTPLTIVDNDSDTIPDYHDIDADDDGIPDNVEAQSTDGWVAPSGVGTAITDSNNNGVDDVYENLTSGLVGVTPVNFDGVDNPDYLDLDSDNDDIPDIEENGNANDTLSGTDTDGDGLDDNFDNNNDSAIAGSTVNDDHNPPSGANLGDEDADIGLGGDADYRDAPDTDGDGIIDPIDIDDDNDGILDVNECDLSFTAGAIPTVEGDAITLDDGVGNQQRILTQDDDGAEFDNVADVLVVSFGTTLTPGSTVTLRMQNDGVGSTNEIQVQQATAGDGTGASNPLTFSGITDAWVDYTYTIEGTDATHLRISMPVDGGQKTDVDHVTWNRLDCDANGDTDGDGIPNSLDLDSDNDGIPDNIEAQSTLGYVAATPFAPTGFDDDGDGLDNAYDATPNGGSDGAGSNGLTAVDTDGDGFPDFVDLDADGDAIFDVEESADPTLTNDGNGQLTGIFGDNGLLDGLEASDDYADVNGTFDETQGDNFTDEDNDVNAPSGDLDYRDTDFTLDTDGDGVLDTVDLDDDNDGVSDIDEGFVPCPSEDTTIMSVSSTLDILEPDPISYTSLYDGIINEQEVFKFEKRKFSDYSGNQELFRIGFAEAVALTQIVIDLEDGQFLLESGITYRVEGLDGATWTDLTGTITANSTVNQEVINFSSNTTAYSTFRILLTGGGDSEINYKWVEEISATAASCTPVDIDSDGDTIPDHLDSDSDNDGITDVIEAGGTDPDNDGYIGTGAITDVDGDGFEDSVDDEDGGNQSGAGEVTSGTPLEDGDFDGDGINNRLDLDSDNDGITDIVESDNGDADTNNDGVADSNDTGFTDTNNNGQADNTESTIIPNTDDNGNLDFLDIDADDDGIPDNVEGQPTVGYITPSGNDNNSNGIDDAYEGTGFIDTPEDTDNDDTPDYLDLDSDSDGVRDTIEAGQGIFTGVDTDGDGLDDGFDVSDDTGGSPDVNDNLNSGADGTDNDDVPGTTEVDFREATDTDNDGIPDYIDIDDDNDGIPDLVETNGLDPLADLDGDGVVAYLDDDDNDDQVGNDDGLTQAPFDTDGDGVPNHLDLDADNDGITDVIEAGGSDPDNDGIIGSGPITDADGDGLDDSVDNIDSGSGGSEVTGGTALAVPDTDGDNLPNYLDIDADNDGIPDNVEGQPTTGYVAPSGIGTGMTDANNNGVDDNYESGAFVGVTPENTDGADNPDYIDADSDNDGILDIAENGDGDNTLSGNDVDGDGLDDNFDDNDDSGIAGSTVNDNHNPPSAANLGDEDADLGAGGDVDYRDALDSDNDGIPDNIDIDDDNDGIPDLVEVPSDPLADNDGDGVVAYLDDDDNDDQVGNDDGLTQAPFDTDGDGVPNHLDLDADNDGITDVIEAGGSDPDNDGIIGSGPITDADGDGLDDSVDNIDSGSGGSEVTGGTALAVPDTDGDNLPNYLDIDADNDGIPDNVEGQPTTGYVAPSGIGTGMTDANNNGVDDNYESGAFVGVTPENTDGADNPDYIDADSDNDGILDIAENGDGDNTLSGNDVDGDGLDDNFDDNDDSGIAGSTVNDNHNPPSAANLGDEDADLGAGGDVDYRDALDSDNDGIPDNIDIDDDNDGIPDLVETNGLDPLADLDGDGVVAYLDDDDNDDQVGNDDGLTQAPFDTDGDGVPNHLDLDADNDGITDVIEAGGSDPDNDGIIGSGPITDADGDGLDDSVDNIDSGSGGSEVTGGTALAVPDTDGDNLPNYLDIDADNDGIPDNVEGQPTTGYVAPSGIGTGMTDANNNGVDDNYESGAFVGVTPENTDGADNPDYIDADSDNDGILDIAENGDGDNTLSGNDVDGDGLDDNFDDNDDSGIAGSTVNDNHNPPSAANLGDEDADLGAGGDVDYRDALDSDNDGIPDNIDIDDDNDGIPDLVEVPSDPLADNDGDGVVAYLDDDDNDDQVGNDDGLTQAPFDTDGDGVPNHLDLDADNDGIPDNVEGQTTLGYIAPTGNVGANGLDSAYENNDTPSATGLTPENTDGVDEPDYLDLDSDNDGDFDIVESGDGLTDANNDGQTDGTVGVNGLDDTIDDDGADTDGDGFDGGDNYVDVNGNNDNTQGDNFTDTDGDVNNPGGDVDYRDVPIFIQTVDGPWDVASNWIDNQVPTVEDDAIIAADVQSTVTQDQAVKSLVLEQGTTELTTVDIDDTFTVNVKESLANNGEFIGDGEVLLDGPANQDMSGSGDYENLRVNNPNGVDVLNVNLNDPTEINGVLYVDDGDFTTSDNVLFPCFFTEPTTGDFENGSAGQIGPIGASASISGDVRVEQCYPGRRAYRYVSASTNTTTSIHDNWQENATAYNDFPTNATQEDGIEYGFGTHITGVVPDPNQNAVGQQGLDQTDGLDWQPSGNASMFDFDESTQSFNPVLVTSPATLTAGKVYNMIIRGSREVDLETNASDTYNTKLRSTGTAVKGDHINSHNISAGQYMLVGNPFHAIVDMVDVRNDNTGINRFMVAYDPTLGGNASDTNSSSTLEAGRGAFVTIDLAGVFPPNSVFSGSEMSHYLQAYQGVFMRSEVNNPTMTFGEVHKAVDQEQIDVFSTPTDMVAIKLYDQESYDDNNTPDDFTVIKFGQNENNGIDYDDAFKFTNPDENMGRLEGNSYLTYENREMPQIDEVLELYTFNYRTTDYVFVAKVDGLLNNTVYLYDNFTNTETVLNNDASTAVSFTIDPANPSSEDPNRFELRFETSTLGTTEFDLEGISVYPNPASDILNINLADNTGRFERLELYDIRGRLVATKNLSNNVLDVQIDVNNFNSGVYLLKVSSGAEQFSTKVIIE